MVVKMGFQAQTVPFRLGAIQRAPNPGLSFGQGKDTLERVRSQAKELKYKALEAVLSSKEPAFNLNGEKLSPLEVLDLLRGLDLEKKNAFLLVGGVTSACLALGGALFASIIAIPLIPLGIGAGMAVGGLATLLTYADGPGISLQQQVAPLSSKPLQSDQESTAQQEFQQVIDRLVEAQLLQQSDDTLTITPLGKQVASAYRKEPDTPLHAEDFLPKNVQTLAQKEPPSENPRSAVEIKAEALLNQVSAQHPEEEPNLLETLQQEQKAGAQNNSKNPLR
jgi:hypothetical protein